IRPTAENSSGLASTPQDNEGAPSAHQYGQRTGKPVEVQLSPWRCRPRPRHSGHRQARETPHRAPPRAATGPNIASPKGTAHVKHALKSTVESAAHTL